MADADIALALVCDPRGKVGGNIDSIHFTGFALRITKGHEAQTVRLARAGKPRCALSKRGSSFMLYVENGDGPFFTTTSEDSIAAAASIESTAGVVRIRGDVPREQMVALLREEFARRFPLRVKKLTSPAKFAHWLRPELREDGYRIISVGAGTTAARPTIHIGQVPRCTPGDVAPLGYFRYDVENESLEFIRKSEKSWRGHVSGGLKRLIELVRHAPTWRDQADALFSEEGIQSLRANCAMMALTGARRV